MSSFVLVSSLLLLSELVLPSFVFKEEGLVMVVVAWMAICLSGFFSFPLPNVAVAIAVVLSASSFPSPLAAAAAAGFGSSDDDDGSVIV